MSPSLLPAILVILAMLMPMAVPPDAEIIAPPDGIAPINSPVGSALISSMAHAMIFEVFDEPAQVIEEPEPIVFTPPDEPVRLVAVSESVSAYAEPDTDSEVLGYLAEGDIVDLISMGGDWFYILNSRGNTAYCLSAEFEVYVPAPFWAQFSSLRAGDTFFLGEYEQLNDGGAPEPIEWIVLDKFDECLFVISKLCLDADSYYDPPGIKYKYITYEGSHVRAFLNEVFYETAFTPEERALIALTRNLNRDNPEYGIDGGEPTQDYVFLISHDECYFYFPTLQDRRASCTPYATAHRAESHGGACYWWLRTPGKFRCNAEFVYDSGRVTTYGSDVGHDTLAFRPAMTLYLTPDISQAAQGAWQNPNFVEQAEE